MTDSINKKGKRRPKISTKVMRALQQEINSQCPFCSNTEVSGFEFHHIDENPSNNIVDNLIMLCGTCHNKITNRDISAAHVIQIKQNLKLKLGNVELVDVTVDSNKCGWEADEDFEYTFYRVANGMPSCPVFVFQFINHTKKTIVLKSIKLQVTIDESASLGSLNEPAPVPYSKKNIIVIEAGKTVHAPLNFESIQIPGEQAWKVPVELADFQLEDGSFALDSQNKKLSFTFEFSTDIKVNIPAIYIESYRKPRTTSIVQLLN